MVEVEKHGTSGAEPAGNRLSEDAEARTEVPGAA